MYVVYMLKKDGEIFYIGTTKNNLRNRLSEHIYEKNLSKDVSIEKICSIENKKDAIEKENSLINLIGKHRLINKINGRKSLYGIKRNVFPKTKKIWTDEMRARHSKKLIGIKKRAGSRNEFLKKIGAIEFDLYINDSLIGRYINQTEAAMAAGLPKSTFVDILKGKRKKTKGIRVVYV